MLVRACVNRAHGGKDAAGVELDEHFGHVVVGLGESHPVVVSVVNRVENLHEHVAKDVQLLKALLIDAQGLYHVAADAPLRVMLVNLSRHPVMRGQVVVDPVYHVGEVGEAQLVALVARNLIAVFGLELIVV